MFIFFFAYFNGLSPVNQIFKLRLLEIGSDYQSTRDQRAVVVSLAPLQAHRQAVIFIAMFGINFHLWSPWIKVTLNGASLPLEQSDSPNPSDHGQGSVDLVKAQAYAG